MDAIEKWIRGICGIVAFGTLFYALFAILGSLRQPKGREESGARLALRAPALLISTLLFVLAGVILWRPLPLQVPAWLRVLLFSAGGTIFIGGLGFYLWGMRSLGKMFAPSSGFGVRLHAGHRLVTMGPYAHVRHPMYLAVIVTAIGSLLLYRTWATLAFAILIFGLAVRARREERVLAQEFGPEWEAYTSKVPGWFPRLRRRR